MKGYSKIKELDNPFAQKSRSKKELQFLDQNVDLQYSTPSSKKPQDLNPHQPPINVDETKNREKNIFFLAKSHHEDVQQEEEKDGGDDNRRRKSGVTESFGASLRRNFSVSSATSSYQKNRGIINNYQLERQSSTRSIQDAVRRAFSRASSVNNSDRYCRIYDQPMIMDGDNYDYDSNYYQGFEKRNYNNDDNINDGSMEIRSMSMKKKEQQQQHHHYGNNGKRHVGPKVVKACKRLFSR